MGLRLADITHDVNHTLGALIHLVQALNHDLKVMSIKLVKVDLNVADDDLLEAFLRLLPKLGHQVDNGSVFVMTGGDDARTQFPVNKASLKLFIDIQTSNQQNPEMKECDSILSKILNWPNK